MHQSCAGCWGGLGFDLTRLSVNPKTVSHADLVFRVEKDKGRGGPNRDALVLLINCPDEGHETFPLPNRTRGAAGYAEEIRLFPSAKRRGILRCARLRSLAQ